MTPTPAGSAVPLHPLLAQRWSPRAFDPDHDLDRQDLLSLLEAARWAPSAANSQPWRFGVALRGTPSFDALLAALAPGNQLWADRASALVLIATQVVSGDGSRLRWAEYDAGQAAALLTVQAEAVGLAVHQMGGFQPERVADVFALDSGVTPVTVLAVGRRSDDVPLPAPLADRERQPRERRPLPELLLVPADDVLPLSA